MTSGCRHVVFERNLLERSVDCASKVVYINEKLTQEQVIAHRAPSLFGQATLATHSVEQPLQYKLEETGANYFAKGTGKGFI